MFDSVDKALNIAYSLYDKDFEIQLLLAGEGIKTNINVRCLQLDCSIEKRILKIKKETDKKFRL